MAKKFKPTTKTFSAVAVKAAGGGVPDAAQLTEISHYLIEDIPAEELYVRTFNLAHNGIDRDREVIDNDLMEDLARTLVGKGFFIIHPMSWDGDSGPGEGRTFKTEVITLSLDAARELLREPDLQFPPETTEAKILQASFYMVRTDSNKDLLKKIDAGIAGDVSIGFSNSRHTEILGADENVIARLLMAPGEAYEASLVWLGAQPGARIVKHLNHDITEEPDMALTPEEIKALQDAKAKQATQISKLTSTTKCLAIAVATALSLKDFDPMAEGSLDDLLTSAENIKALAEDGRAYRDELVDSAVAAKRLLKEVGDTDDEVNAAKSFYKSMPLSMLKTEVAGLQKRAPAQQSQLDGSDPNKQHDDGKGKGLRDASVTQKALGNKTQQSAAA